METSPVLSIWMRTGVTPSTAATRPRSMAGADGREDIAAALRVGNDGLIDKDLEEETVDVGVGPGGG